jgi:hypothetical protein
MNRNFTKVLLILFSTFLVTVSCHTVKIVKKTESFHLENRSTKSLIQLMKQNEFCFNTMSAKMNVEADFNGSTNSLTVSVRCRKDSAIWLSISPALGIEVARLLVTKDSVKLRNGLKKTYFVGDFNYLSKLLNTELDYDMVESLLLGNSVSFYDEDEKLHSSEIQNNYVLSTIRKRKLRKVIQKNEVARDLAQIIWLNPVNFRIDKIMITDQQTNRSFLALYSDLQTIDSLLLPMKARFDISAEKKATINVEYTKVTLNTPQTFPFSIPESYERRQ